MGFPSGLRQRETQILSRVHVGDYQVSWTEIESLHADHRATFTVFSDALKIEGVRINCSAHLQQQIADALGCCLLTAKLPDLIYAQAATRLPPMPRKFVQTVEAMIDQSAKLDTAIAAKAGGTQPGLVSTVGKHWLIDNSLKAQPNRAMNYGWHFVGSKFQGESWAATATPISDPKGPVRLIQGRATAHDAFHTDYSQNCVLVSRTCYVDSVEMDLLDVLTSAELAPLASHQGVMKVLRQPGVDQPR